MLLPANAAFDSVIVSPEAMELRAVSVQAAPRLRLVASAPVVRRIGSWPFTAAFHALEAGPSGGSGRALPHAGFVS